MSQRRNVTKRPLPAAVHVLKACGLYGLVSPAGTTDPQKIALEQQRRAEDAEIAQQRRHQALTLARLAAGL